MVVSNVLFLVVIVCIFLKLILCIGVVFTLRDDPLVTLGDAVALFISTLDPTIIGRCAATLPEIRSRVSE